MSLSTLFSVPWAFSNLRVLDLICMVSRLRTPASRTLSNCKPVSKLPVTCHCLFNVRRVRLTHCKLLWANVVPRQQPHIQQRLANTQSMHTCRMRWNVCMLGARSFVLSWLSCKDACLHNCISACTCNVPTEKYQDWLALNHVFSDVHIVRIVEWRFVFVYLSSLAYLGSEYATCICTFLFRNQESTSHLSLQALWSSLDKALQTEATWNVCLGSIAWAVFTRCDTMWFHLFLCQDAFRLNSSDWNLFLLPCY